MRELRRLIYSSRPTIALNEAQVGSMADAFADRNLERGVSGTMLFESGFFLQILEGPPDAIATLVETIRHDTRHADMRILGDVSSDVRAFSGWHMRYLSNVPALLASRPHLPQDVIETLRTFAPNTR